MLTTRPFESLETRLFLAAHGPKVTDPTPTEPVVSAVRARVIDGHLLIFGDRHANGISIDAEGLDAGQLRITGNDTTTVNGEFSVIVSGIRKDVRIDLGRGDDTLSINNVDVPRGLRISSGDGDDRLLLQSADVGKDLKIRTGHGDDQVDILGGSIDRDSDINTGSGHDLFTAEGVAFEDDFKLETNSGNDTVYLAPSTLFEGKKRARTGPGQDLFSSQAITDTTNFTNGLNGWTGGFADYSDDMADMRREWSLRDLPAEVGAGKGFYIQGMNRSDDLMMFLTRAVGGLKPNTSYQVRFDLTIASNAGSGCAGVGGAPGESVYLKAGASTNTPTVSKDAQDHWRPDFDAGQQSQGGRDASLVGNIANGFEDCSDDAPYVSLNKKHIHAYTVKTDANGKLHLIVATDSGYEGLTALYYQQIKAQFVEMAPQN